MDCRINPEHGAALSRGMCRPCYAWTRRHGREPGSQRPIRCYSPASGHECGVDGCTAEVTARGLCRRHYDQWRWHGTAGSQFSPHAAIDIMRRRHWDLDHLSELLAALEGDEGKTAHWRERVRSWQCGSWLTLDEADLFATLTLHHIDELWPQKKDAA